MNNLLLLALLLGFPFGCERANDAAAPATKAAAPAKDAAPGQDPAEAPAALGADEVRMQVGKDTFTLEIADEPREHQRGLMARESMAWDRGMIFVFRNAEPRAFWMKDTLIPLDIVYLDPDGRVVSVKSMVPRDLNPVPSDSPAMYAIELNQGAAAQAGVRRGDVVSIPQEIRDRAKR